MKNVQSMQLAEYATCRVCTLQNMQLAEYATCRICNLQNMQLAKYATCRICNLQNKHNMQKEYAKCAEYAELTQSICFSSAPQ